MIVPRKTKNTKQNKTNKTFAMKIEKERNDYVEMFLKVAINFCIFPLNAFLSRSSFIHFDSFNNWLLRINVKNKEKTRGGRGEYFWTGNKHILIGFEVFMIKCLSNIEVTLNNLRLKFLIPRKTNFKVNLKRKVFWKNLVKIDSKIFEFSNLIKGF